tara:strand:- start:82 stop:246 length:165 start_codon:yes stop_codon:yes gene_type:complete
MTYQTTIEANGRDVADGIGQTEAESIAKAIAQFDARWFLSGSDVTLIRTADITQ